MYLKASRGLKLAYALKIDRYSRSFLPETNEYCNKFARGAADLEPISQQLFEN